jgi:hypothetical protein
LNDLNDLNDLCGNSDYKRAEELETDEANLKSIKEKLKKVQNYDVRM